MPVPQLLANVFLAGVGGRQGEDSAPGGRRRPQATAGTGSPARALDGGAGSLCGGLIPRAGGSGTAGPTPSGGRSEESPSPERPGCFFTSLGGPQALPESPRALPSPGPAPGREVRKVRASRSRRRGLPGGRGAYLSKKVARSLRSSTLCFTPAHRWQFISWPRVM